MDYCLLFLLSVDFGVVSELPMGPKLEHVTKSRPKPARTRRGSRRVLDETDGPGSDSVVSPPPTSPPVSNGDSKATDEASKTREEVKVVIDEPPVSPTKDKAKQKEPKSPKRSSKRESKWALLWFCLHARMHLYICVPDLISHTVYLCFVLPLELSLKEIEHPQTEVGERVDCK